jgi:hypothetical protein
MLKFIGILKDIPRKIKILIENFQLKKQILFDLFWIKNSEKKEKNST